LSALNLPIRHLIKQYRKKDGAQPKQQEKKEEKNFVKLLNHFVKVSNKNQRTVDDGMTMGGVIFFELTARTQPSNTQTRKQKKNVSVFRCHLFVILCRWKGFATRFLGETVEEIADKVRQIKKNSTSTESSKQDNVITLENVRPEIFEIITQYLYTGVLSKVTEYKQKNDSKDNYLFYRLGRRNTVDEEAMEIITELYNLCKFIRFDEITEKIDEELKNREIDVSIDANERKKRKQEEELRRKEFEREGAERIRAEFERHVTTEKEAIDEKQVELEQENDRLNRENEDIEKQIRKLHEKKEMLKRASKSVQNQLQKLSEIKKIEDDERRRRVAEYVRKSIEDQKQRAQQERKEKGFIRSVVSSLFYKKPQITEAPIEYLRNDSVFQNIIKDEIKQWICSVESERESEEDDFNYNMETRLVDELAENKKQFADDMKRAYQVIDLNREESTECQELTIDDMNRNAALQATMDIQLIALPFGEERDIGATDDTEALTPITPINHSYIPNILVNCHSDFLIWKSDYFKIAMTGNFQEATELKTSSSALPQFKFYSCSDNALLSLIQVCLLTTNALTHISVYIFGPNRTR
jgi:hypothetical protein